MTCAIYSSLAYHVTKLKRIIADFKLLNPYYKLPKLGRCDATPAFYIARLYWSFGQTTHFG